MFDSYSRRTTTLLFVATLELLVACRDMAAAPSTNSLPIANAGMDRELSDPGEGVEVTLDGSGSRDPDGEIVAYLWLSGDAEEKDGGLRRVGPDPKDVVNPKVTLEAGTWTFTLWVEDDHGGISAPDNVVIRVGQEVSPAAMECAEEVVQTISEECRLCVCDIDDGCRDSAVECDDDCWGLMFCADENCADVDPSDMAAISTCVTTNCIDFLGSGLQIQAFGSCRDQCLDVCSASAQAGGGASDDVRACADDMPDGVPEPCRLCLCELDDACRAAAMGCNQDCWDLVACVDQMCGDETAMAGRQACVIDMCADLLGAGLALQALEPCRQQCSSECDLSTL